MDAAEMALKARSLLEDPLLIEIFSHLESRYINDWRNTQPADGQKREAAHAAMRGLEDIRGRLHSLANAPKVDAHNNRNAGKR